MQLLLSFTIGIVVLLTSSTKCEEISSGVTESPIVLNELGQTPNLLLSIIARNEEKTLPTYLGYIERLNYPKSHISIL